LDADHFHHTVTKFRVRKKVGNSSAKWDTVSLLRRASQPALIDFPVFSYISEKWSNKDLFHFKDLFIHLIFMLLSACLLRLLTLILLTWRIWRAPNNASKWQMGFNLLAPEFYI
jgi:hypothetical protein